MDEDPEIWFREGTDVSNAMIVVAAPTLGFVGPITAQFLVRQLEMDTVGGIVADSLPAVARIGRGRSSFPIAVHHRETRCGLQGDCERLVVVETELSAPVPAQHRIARTIVDWADREQAAGIVAPDGLFVQSEEADGVLGAGSSDEALEQLEKQGVEPIEAGYLAGLSAALLCYGEMADVETLALLAESNPSYPDARAAARIVSVLDGLIPEISIETEPLIEEAERIEEHVRREVESLQARYEEKPDEGGMMFT